MGVGVSFRLLYVDRQIHRVDMFTALAVCVVAVSWYSARCHTKDRQQRPGLFDDDEVRQSVLHARQDLKLIAFLVGRNRAHARRRCG
jgi:hypothetical protein